MQIKLSKAQWEFIGKKAGWMKEAQTPVVNTNNQPVQPAQEPQPPKYTILDNNGKCEVQDDKQQQVYTGSKEACEGWVKANGGQIASQVQGPTPL